MIGNITFKYDGQLTTLEKLREVLPDSLLLPALEEVLTATQTASLTRTPCPIHNKLPQVIVEISKQGKIDVQTVSCCEMMEKKVTQSLKNSLNATAYFQPGMTLSLQILDDYSTPYEFDAHTIKKLVIGRYSADDRSQLDLDLNDHGGRSKGVSRRHAYIIWKSGALHIVDNGSANGTFLNGAHLSPFVPQKLRDKDVIRLGKLHIEIKVEGE